MSAVCKVLGLSNSEGVSSDLIFTEMDTNSDGMIDQKEFMEACKGNTTLMERLGHSEVKLHLI